MVSSPWPPAMRRSTSSKCAVVALALVVSFLALAPQSARADDRASVEAGRAAGRAILILRDPRACAVALLRDRCIADVDAFLGGRGDVDFGQVPKVGPHPASGLRSFVADGDREGFDFALSWFNNRQATPAQWKTDARNAALYDAGILDVFLAAAGPDEVRQMLGAVPAADLAMHAGEIPDGALPADVAPLRALHMTRPNGLTVLPFARDLVRALRQSIPAPSLAELPNVDKPSTDAALGVAVATLSELLDAAQWAAQGDVQSFATGLADRLDALMPPAGRGAAATFRARVQTGAPFDRAAANGALAAAIAVYGTAGPPERAQRVALGSAAAQLAYNAAIPHSAESSRNLLTVLAGSDALDAAIAGWGMARATGASIGPSDWLAQHAYALRLVDLIGKANRS
jgi:hypothetical protein